jgi:hypothetical protein
MKKCESCRFYWNFGVDKSVFVDALCKSPEINEIAFQLDPDNHFSPLITDARDICDKEHDGHFVYFEPKVPTTGAVVQITRSREPKARHAAAGGIV